MRTIVGPAQHPFRRIAGVIAGVLAVALIAVPAASAAPTPFVDIHSAGPLSDIYIGNDLGCQVRGGGFSSTEFFPNAAGPGDCGTFMETGSDSFQSELLGPDFANHPGGTHTAFANGEVSFTPVSQSLAGSGTSASPYQVDDGCPGDRSTGCERPVGRPPVHGGRHLRGRQRLLPNGRDGLEYRTGSAMDAQATLYHAADCQLRGSTTGFGIAEPPLGATVVGVSCSLSTTSDAVREEFVPITPSGGSFTELPAGTIVAGPRGPSSERLQHHLLEQRRQWHRDPGGASAVSPTARRRPSRSTP